MLTLSKKLIDYPSVGSGISLKILRRNVREKKKKKKVFNSTKITRYKFLFAYVNLLYIYL